MIFILLLSPSLNIEASTELIGEKNYFDEGRFYFLKGEYDKAIEFLNKAHEVSPNNAFYNQYLGKLYFELKEYNKAKKYLIRAKEINPKTFGLTYDIALLLFYQKEYLEASELFMRIISRTKSDARNTLSSYYNGLCLFKQKKYQKAIYYLQEASNQSPTLTVSSNYYIGICELKLGHIDKCEQRLTIVLSKAKSQGLYDLEKFASNWLQFIEKRKKSLKPYYLFCKLFYHFDDNVFLNPDSENLYQDTNDFSTVGFFSIGYDIFNHNNYLINIGYSNYQSWYNDHTLFNMTGSVFDLKTTYKYSNDFNISFLYMPSFYRIDHKSVINRHTFSPQIRWYLSDDSITDLSISYDINNNINDERDGYTSDIVAAFYHIFPKSDLFVFGKLGYESRSADHTDYEYNNLRIESGTSFDVLNNNIYMKCAIKYSQKSYKNPDITYRAKRKDNRYGINFDISYVINRRIKINTEYQNIINDSNINKFEYKKSIFLLSVTFDY